MAGSRCDRNIRFRPAEHGDRIAGRFTVGGSLQSPPHRKRIKHQDTAAQSKKPLDQSFRREGLTTTLLAKNGDVGVERHVRDGTRVSHDASYISFLILSQL